MPPDRVERGSGAGGGVRKSVFQCQKMVFFSKTKPQHSKTYLWRSQQISGFASNAKDLSFVSEVPPPHSKTYLCDFGCFWGWSKQPKTYLLIFKQHPKLKDLSFDSEVVRPKLKDLSFELGSPLPGILLPGPLALGSGVWGVVGGGVYIYIYIFFRVSS